MSENVKRDRITNFVTETYALQVRDLIRKIAPQIGSVAPPSPAPAARSKRGGAPTGYHPKSPHCGKHFSTKAHEAMLPARNRNP